VQGRLPALDRAEFALEQLRKQGGRSASQASLGKNAERDCGSGFRDSRRQRLQKISDAVHARNPAPHLRLLPDAESSRRRCTDVITSTCALVIGLGLGLVLGLHAKLIRLCRIG
jgi:hypothetical protein